MLSETRPWVEEEDKCLRFIYEGCSMSKWSQVARQLAEYGWKGRNGKQCKERYCTHINPAPLKEDWSHQEEQQLFALHNQIGNKWAVIGKQLGGKSDNCVKNHFYSRLRRALKRINATVQQQNRKDLKEFKPAILYRVVEVAEEKFKVVPCHDKDYFALAGKLKNDLIELAYAAEEEEDDDNFTCEETAKQITEELAYFNLHYRKKGKKSKGGQVKQYSEQGQDLLTPHRYQSNVKRSHSEYDESEGGSDMIALSEASEEVPSEEDNTPRTKSNTNRRRKSSGNSLEETVPAGSLRTRALSQGNLFAPPTVLTSSNSAAQSSGVGEEVIEGMLGQMNLLEEEEEMAPHPLLMKRETSQKSRNSDMGDEEPFRFFEDSEIELRIMPQMGVLRRDSHCEESIFN